MLDQRLIAVVPAYREGPRIAAVVRGAQVFLQVVVVDDGSSDDTVAQATAAGATVVRQVPNQGKGAALRTGFRYALDAGAEAVITLDGDGQHDPAEIPALIEAYRRTRGDLVIGRRTFGSMPFSRRLSNTIGRMIISVAVGRDVPDNQSGYRLVGKRLMAVMLESGESGFGFEVEMIARCIAAGHSIEWVPIRTIYAGEPSHIRPVEHFTGFLRVARAARRIVRGADA